MWKKCFLFICKKKKTKKIPIWLTCETSYRPRQRNGGEGRDERRRKWEWSGGAAHGSSFFSCHPFNCFLAVVTMTGLQGERSCSNTHKCPRAHASDTVWQSCQGRVEMTPYFRAAPPFTPTTHKFTVSIPASEATITICTERSFIAVEGIEVTTKFIGCIKFYD